MRGFILGIAILMVAPGYAAGQQGDRSGRSTTGRTAVPREEAVRTDPARQTDRRAEARGTRTPTRHDQKPDDATQSRVGRERRSTATAAEAARGRPLNPGFLSPLNPGFRTGDYLFPSRGRHRGANVVFVPYAAAVVVEREVVIEREVAVEAAGESAIIERPSLARLILDIDPPTAQVFSDGFYIGIPEDFRFADGGAVLEPGPHRIDILARDYEPVSVDVNLTRGQSATFRHKLMPIARTVQPAPGGAVNALPVSKQPSTFYLIPGCYMGNVPPKDANLPSTCDIARAVSFQY